MREKELKRKEKDAQLKKKQDDEQKLEDKITGRDRRMKTMKFDQESMEEDKVPANSEGILSLQLQIHL